MRMGSLRRLKYLLCGVCICTLVVGCAPGESSDEIATETPDEPAEIATAEPAHIMTETPTTASEPDLPAEVPTLSSLGEALLGQWMNLDQDSGGYSWFTIRQEDDEAVAHFWGQCSPQPCDIGEFRFPITDINDGQIVVSYDFANGTNTSEIVVQEDLSVQVTTTVDFTEASGFEDTTTVYAFQDSTEVTGIAAYVGTWVNDQPAEAEYTYLSIALVEGELVVFAKAIISGQVHDFGQFEGIEDMDDGDLFIDYPYPGGGLISGECVPGGDGTLVVTMFAEHMVDGVYTSHDSVIVMRRVD
jgi:hypothetical protein